jgi:hypothetical protein
MNWDAIGAVSNIVGAIAVFGSLIYLAIQIRSQNKESRLNAMHDISVGFRDATSKFATADMAPILVKANKDYDALSEDEAMRLIILSGQFFRAWEEAFIQHQEGRLDARSWNAIHKYYVNILSSPAIQHAWGVRRDYFDIEFAAFVDSQALHEYKIR